MFEKEKLVKTCNGVFHHFINKNNSKTYNAHISTDRVPKVPTRIQHINSQKLTNTYMAIDNGDAITMS